jgi:Carbohydrate binding module (family 6)
MERVQIICQNEKLQMQLRRFELTSSFTFKLKFTVLISIIFCIAAINNCLAKNPLNTIAAANSDKVCDSIKLEACSEGGSNLCSICSGSYVVFKGYDFDSGVAAFKARVAGKSDCTMEIHLDGLLGPVMGKCQIKKSGGWQQWQDIYCEVDNSQSGIRDIYLIFYGEGAGALVNLQSCVFLKSISSSTKEVPAGFADRVDAVDDEPQGTNAWGIPENGFLENFENGRLDNWQAEGFSVTTNALDGNFSAISHGEKFGFAFTPNVYINKTDTGGEWRTLAEAALSGNIVVDAPQARPGIGFISKDQKQFFHVDLNCEKNSIEVWRKLAGGSATSIKLYSLATNTSAFQLQVGVKYRLQLNWSPYSDGLIVFLQDAQGGTIASFRTVIDLPVARRPLLVCSGGEARFDDIHFDPNLDDWNFKWQWKKMPVLASDVCNPAIWKANGKYYMMWRKFGADNYHGIVASTDAVHWTRVRDDVLKCTGDMNVLVNPFGDGLVYATPGGGGMPWWTSDGKVDFTVWKKSGLNVGGIFGNCRIQEIVDTKKYSQIAPVKFQGSDYRFIAFCEDWNREPKPHTVVLLSNTLTNWVLANSSPVLSPGTNFWGEKGSAIGSAFVLPDGNILLADCACTFAGYTGAPEPSNVSVIVDGKEPWKVLRVGILPDAPVSREPVWYEGPNFGTAFYYEPENDTLFYYGGFHDYYIGMMRVENFSKSKLFKQN